MAMKGDPTKGLLLDTLMVAVPLRIAQLRDVPPAQLQAMAKACAPIIAEKGDILQYRSSKPGATAEVFNRMAEGLACLALLAGSVPFMGIRFTREGQCLPVEPG